MMAVIGAVAGLLVGLIIAFVWGAQKHSIGYDEGRQAERDYVIQRKLEGIK